MRKSKTVLLAAILLVTAACIHKQTGTVTPKEKAATFNAVFAETNNTIEQGAEAAVRSGLLTPEQGAPVIAFTGQAATVHLQITAILAQSTITTKDIASIQALLDQIKKSGDQAIASGAIGIKNPKTQNTFAKDFDSLYAAADAILSALQQLQAGG